MMEKAIAALILAAIEIVDQVWGDQWFGHVTEESIGVLVALLFPLAVWFVPNRR